MKKLFAVYAAIAALVSCSKAEGTYAEKSVGVGIDASLSEISKAQFGALSEGKYPLVWNDGGETALLVEFADGAKKEVAFASYTKVSDKKASFGFSLPSKEASNYDYYMIAPYEGTTKCGARIGGTPPSGFEGAVSYALLHADKIQTPLADAPDPTTHIVLASDKGKASQGGNLSMNFQSVVSYGKMKITGFPALASGETASKIVITAPAGTIMRGRLWRNPDGSTEEFSSGAQSNFVNVDPKNITFNTTGFDVWFTTFPFALKAGDKLDVSVSTNKGLYNASITLSKGLEFKEGVVSSFTYNWAKGQSQPEGPLTLSFDFTKTLEGWPTAKNTPWTGAKGLDSGHAAENGGTATDNPHRRALFSYPLDGKEYDFMFVSPDNLNTDKNIYLSLGKGVYSGTYRSLGLPAIEGMKLTKLVMVQNASTKDPASFNRGVGICKNIISADGTTVDISQYEYVPGGELQNQCTNLGEYTYNLSGTEAGVMYYLNSPQNASIIKTLVLTYETGSDAPVTSISSRIGTYNIRMSNIDSGDNAWAKRKDRLFSSIDACAFDIFGVQEVTSAAQTDLKTKYGASYGCYFFSPYSQSGVGDKAHGVLYRSNLFTISDIHNFWMGPDPAVMSTSDTGTQGSYNRGGFCCVFTHKTTGKKLFFMCTHACLNDEPNATYAPIYVQMEKKYNTAGLPSFFVGDMNAKTKESPYATYTSHWKDAFVLSAGKTGCANTFNGYKSAEGSTRIDYVFWRGSASALKYCCDNTLYGGLYPSDHFPVYVDFKLIY